MPVVKTLTDGRAGGYVGQGIYKGPGMSFPLARIIDANAAHGFQRIPTMAGRDTCNLNISIKNGNEYLAINKFVYVDAASAIKFSEAGNTVTLGAEPVWADIDADAGRQIIHISAPDNGSWFAYDDKMNCVATSLEKHPRGAIILPENGRLLFAGEPGASFTVQFL